LAGKQYASAVKGVANFTHLKQHQLVLLVEKELVVSEVKIKKVCPRTGHEGPKRE
jgi:hypothetical protein